ncbi:MAG: DNA polymerase [Leptospiraceae bacterium]|nr:DNA polymerase [Leptospiraceae bacterium]
MSSSPEKKDKTLTVSGWLFDIYHLEDQIYLCILDENGAFYLCRDHFHPIIYARAPESTLQKLVHRLHEMDGIHERPYYVKRKLFYENRTVDVLSISISRPSILRRIRNRLYAMYGKMDLFHTDFEVPTGYMQQKELFPLCRLKAGIAPAVYGNRGVGPTLYDLQWTRCLDDIYDLDFALPPVRTMRMRLNYGHRMLYQQLHSADAKGSRGTYANGDSKPGPIRQFHLPDQRILLECKGLRLELPVNLDSGSLQELNDFLLQTDPDIILSAYGDQILFPILFRAFQKFGMLHQLDRDIAPGSTRKIITEGTSYNTYGNWIYRAPSYPLFGRWHIDSANSFVYKEAQLMGIAELSRLSRIPVQRLSRSSTGAALTAIESAVALEKNYLVPWQKSALEQPRSVMDLLEADKGGLVFVPRTDGILENVAQIDFSQMYPSIMSLHNVSPETINCLCCEEEDSEHVPEIGFRICTRRRGIVSDALAHILKRRKYYKSRIKELKSQIADLERMNGIGADNNLPQNVASQNNNRSGNSRGSDSGLPGKSKKTAANIHQDLESQREIYDHRQSSLKWMLVTSFGYLGYRNAKFGKIESHEAVTAFGRDKLLTAKELAEEKGYRVAHGITDCLFLEIPDEPDRDRFFNGGQGIVGAKQERSEHRAAGEESPPGSDKGYEKNRRNPAKEEERLQSLCAEIGEATRIEMSLEGIYDWLIFLPSRTKPGISVVNRYFGRFRDGSMRVRGISVRRKDRPDWIKEVQETFLAMMAECRNIQELQSIHSSMENQYFSFRKALRRRDIPWTSLLLRRTVSKGLEDYSVDGPAPAALRELEPYGIQIQAGEKIKYLVLEKTAPRASRYMSEEMALQSFGTEPVAQPPYDIEYYSGLLYDAFEEVWRYGAPPGYFSGDILQQDLPGLSC